MSTPLRDDEDRALIGRFVEREIRATTTWAKFAARNEVSRSTLYRVRDADPRISWGTLLRIERGLSLPSDTFSAVAIHDWNSLRGSSQIDEETVAWLERQSTRTKDSTGSSATDALVTPLMPSLRESAQVVDKR